MPIAVVVVAANVVCLPAYKMNRRESRRDKKREKSWTHESLPVQFSTFQLQGRQSGKPGDEGARRWYDVAHRESSCSFV